MKKPKLFWQLLNSYLWVNIFVLVILAFAIAFTFRYLFVEKYTSDLKSRGILLSGSVKERVLNRDFNKLDREIKDLGLKTSSRITVMLPSGKVVADSSTDASLMGNHSSRPEFLESLKTGIGFSTRFSETLNQDRMYVAIAVNDNGEKLFVLRTSISIATINSTINKVYLQVAVISFFLITINVLISLWLSRRIGNPLSEMVGKFKRIVKYDFSGDIKLTRFDSVEMEAVAGAINNISNELEQKQIEIHKLANMRKEFVANVSHELKTPITSIKGFVETLLDGAINDKKDATEFLNIILRQSNRLDSIINDLLSLSKLENDTDAEVVLLEDNPVILAISTAVDTCRSNASKHGLEINIDCDEKIEAKIDIQLMEQALINLINNAIKYSGTDDPILVSARIKDNSVIISVKDHGVGIPSKHQARIFERFYRVDKARSREQGGTGLGLSIVKHIAALHGGDVMLSSKLGQGSDFQIILNKN